MDRFNSIMYRLRYATNTNFELVTLPVKSHSIKLTYIMCEALQVFSRTRTHIELVNCVITGESTVSCSNLNSLRLIKVTWNDAVSNIGAFSFEKCVKLETLQFDSCTQTMLNASIAITIGRIRHHGYPFPICTFTMPFRYPCKTACWYNAKDYCLMQATEYIISSCKFSTITRGLLQVTCAANLFATPIQ